MSLHRAAIALALLAAAGAALAAPRRAPTPAAPAAPRSPGIGWVDLRWTDVGGTGTGTGTGSGPSNIGWTGTASGSASGTGSGTATGTGTGATSAAPSPGASSALLKSITDSVKGASGVGKGSPASTSASGKGSSAPGSSSGGAGGSSDNLKIGFDDNAAKNNGGGDYGKRKDGEEGGSAPPAQKKANPVAFSRWFPVCVFIDPAVGNGNAMVKGMVDMAAACGVNLVVFPFYIKNMPGNGNQAVAQARQSCNAIQGLGKSMGVNRVATSLVTRNAGLAREMCGGDEPSCEEVSFEVGWEQRMRAANTGRGYNVSPTAASIVGENNPEALASSVFRSITGLPRGNGAGLSLGTNDEGAATSDAPQGRGLNDFGCSELRKSTFPNDGRWKWNPDQDKYIVKGDENRMFELGRQVFRPPNDAPAGGQGQGMAKTTGKGAEGRSEGGGAAVASSGGEGGRSGGGSGGGAGGGGSAGPGAGHKDKGGRNGGIKSVGNLYGSGSSDGGGGGSSPSAVAAALAKEAEGSGGGVGNAMGDAQVVGLGAKGTAGPGGKGDRGKSLGFDDSVKKGGLGPIDYKALAAKGDAAGAGGAGAPGANGAAGAAASAAAGGDGTQPIILSGPGTNAGSVSQQVREGSSALDDDFFKRVGRVAEDQKGRRRSGGGLRNEVRGRVEGSSSLRPQDLYQ